VKSALLAAVFLSLVAASARGSAKPSPLIAFWSDRSGLPGVWVMKPDGTGRRLLTGVRTRAKRGDFSPRGSMLVFDGQPPRGDVFDFDIQVIGVDGHGRKRLTRGPARDLEPRWSPDGSTIVFQRQYGELGARSIWMVSPAGGKPYRLAAGSSPVWSADGERLLISRQTASAWGEDIYVMRTDGRQARLFYRSRDDDYPSAWSHDGKRILFTRISRVRQQADVYSMESDGSFPRRLTRGKGYRLAADWSPNRRQILFTRVAKLTQSERGQVFVMSADGSHVRNLSTNSADENAESWGG